MGAAEKVRGIASTSAAAHRTRLTAIAAAPQAGLDAVDASWRAALIETFPGTAYRTWGKREQHQIKTVLTNWRGDCTFPQFVDWAVRNGTAITLLPVSWQKPNASPR